MDLERISQTLLKWVNLNVKSSNTNGDKPSVSYIVNNIISFSTARDIMIDMEGVDVLRLSYIIYFISEGDDFKTAQNKSNNLYMFDFISVEDIKYTEEECEECYGDGTIECSWCDGDGEEDCTECDNTTTSDEGDEEECDECNGKESVECSNCSGDGNVECSNCDGEGRIESEEEMVSIDENKWVFNSPILAKKLQNEIENNYRTDSSIYAILDDFKNQVYYLGYTNSEETLNDLENNLDITDITTNDVILRGIRKLSSSEPYISLSNFGDSYTLKSLF